MSSTLRGRGLVWGEKGFGSHGWKLGLDPSERFVAHRGSLFYISGCQQPVEGMFWKLNEKEYHENCLPPCTNCQQPTNPYYTGAKGGLVCIDCFWIGHREANEPGKDASGQQKSPVAGQSTSPSADQSKSPNAIQTKSPSSKAAAPPKSSKKSAVRAQQ